jgi:hypothetical protein
MAVDRYVKLVLTVIAVELLWLGIKDGAPPVSAQAEPPATPVIIRGIDLRGDTAFLPVAVVGSYRTVPAPARQTIQPLVAEVTASVPLRIDAVRPLKVEIDQVVTVGADQPLPVKSVPDPATRRVGE